MAALARGTQIGSRLMTFLQRNSPRLKTHIPALPVRIYSSTSKKVNQSEYITGKRTEVDEERIQEIIREGEKAPSLTDPNDPSYVSHGFSDDPYIDLWSYRLIFFVAFSLIMVIGPLYIHYLPESNGRLWARREAELVIAERRKKGLPLIKADLCNPEKLVLPSDEEEERLYKKVMG
ncbi:NADH dehydrogenase [ubiquinone] 1 beta subcomplex subunit 11, mitochondrial-like [Acanthaster planci]|uniref:NADH dehydrogenase [ubiquinone] 1 beta subcomplex subunit 11, mitochondrial n=1 Tax=Acanthaster planci TaxID=133434 RepID=A0A8B7XMK2_ACAPL|nr:NADH dehydrogenase [ubiquinone] 1 beta subcomplex subunit 11, mitochondrial-like [Acanthaster planci]